MLNFFLALEERKIGVPLWAIFIDCLCCKAACLKRLHFLEEEIAVIAYIKGTLEAVAVDSIVVENHQIGYEIRVPLTVIQQLPMIGEEIKIYTYTYVREDIFCLYGFLTKDDLDIFKLLITVNGIGPKGALGILSAVTPDNLRFAILSEDSATIAKAPGVGKKTASRLIIELKDKLNLEDMMQPETAASTEDMGNYGTSQIKQDAIQALVALGYSNTEALKAIGQITITEEMEAEDLLKAALKKII